MLGVHRYKKNVPPYVIFFVFIKEDPVKSKWSIFIPSPSKQSMRITIKRKHLVIQTDESFLDSLTQFVNLINNMWQFAIYIFI